MEPLIILETDDTPSIHLDAIGKFEFTGKSLPEDVSVFYDPVISWISEYAEIATTESKFIFKMTYFNTASSKILLDIFMQLEEMHLAGKSISIEWNFGEDDEDMEEAGEEYSEIVEVAFTFLSY